MRLVMAKMGSGDRDLVALKGGYASAGKEACKVIRKARHGLHRRQWYFFGP